MNTLSLLWLIPALPLLGAIVNGIGAGKLPRKLVSATSEPTRRKTLTKHLAGSTSVIPAATIACFNVMARSVNE